MIGQVLACAALPPSDLKSSRQFYEQPWADGTPEPTAGGAWYEAAARPFGEHYTREVQPRALAQIVQVRP
jgi:hypothetical protein